jgi:hypothetical protein
MTEAKKSFDKLKSLFTLEPILLYFNSELSTFIEIDISDYGPSIFLYLVKKSKL